MKTHYIAFLVTACFAMSHSHAAVIASYDFTGGSEMATTFDANVTAGDVTLGAGLTGGDAGFSSFGGHTNAFARTTVTFGSGVDYPNFTSAKAADDYFTVTITPDAGYVMNLTTFSFDYGYTATDTFTNVSNSLRAYVTTSADNHANFFNGNTDGFTTITNPTANSVNYPNLKSLDLSGGSFQNIASSFEFRIYLGDSYDVNNLIHRIDDVVLNGEVVAVVPEPSSTALLGLGMGALLLRRRRS
jgi:hypothetical protein